MNNLETTLILMARVVSNLFIVGAKMEVMVASNRKEDILLAVSVLSNGLLDSENDRYTLYKTIEDYLAYSNTEAEIHNGCGTQILPLLLIYWNSEYFITVFYILVVALPFLSPPTN